MNLLDEIVEAVDRATAAGFVVTQVATSAASYRRMLMEMWPNHHTEIGYTTMKAVCRACECPIRLDPKLSDGWELHYDMNGLEMAIAMAEQHDQGRY